MTFYHFFCIDPHLIAMTKIEKKRFCINFYRKASIQYPFKNKTIGHSNADVPEIEDAQGLKHKAPPTTD